jgi:molybdopterin synthase catalytic subunit
LRHWNWSTFQAWPNSQLTAIAEQASERWPLHGITIIHRYGKLKPGDPIVLVVTASSHRRAAFEAADFLMDFLKTKAPFWKKEHPASPDEEARWVEAKASDDADADRW